MDKGIYTALSGGMAKVRELEVVANNLANANTPAYKKDIPSFKEYLTTDRRPDSVESLDREIQNTVFGKRVENDKSFVELDQIKTDFRQGGLNRTDRPLDLAIEGSAFFEVNTPGGVQYTRHGGFSMDASGRLVTSNGMLVLGQGAGDPGSRTIRLGNGPVFVRPDGGLIQNGNEVGRLSLVDFAEAKLLEKVGDSLFRNSEADLNPPRPARLVRIHQGFLEISNVNAVSEMTRLIEATRSYETQMQSIKTFQEIDGRSVSNIAKD